MKVFTVLFCLLPFLSFSKIIYVAADNPVPGNGSSWAAGFNEIQEAIDVAEQFDSIWVKKGTYLPTKWIPGYDMYGDKYQAFQMKRRVALIGGFNGSESSFEERDRKKVFTDNLTTLSGNDYYYRVMHNEEELFSDSVVEGFVVERGEANGDSYGERNHPGIHSNGGLFKNLIIRNNSSVEVGGALHMYGRGTVVNCILYNNFSGGSTEAALSIWAEVDIYNCTIIANDNQGGPVNSLVNNVDIYNSLIWGNTQGGQSNAHQISGSNNCTISSCAIEDVVTDSPAYASGNINLGATNDGVDGPRLADPGNHNFELTMESPCVDAGFNLQVINNPYDIFGNDRIIGDKVDIGAIEFTGTSSTDFPTDIFSNIRVVPNPSNGLFGIEGLDNEKIIEARIYDAKGMELSTQLSFIGKHQFEVRNVQGLVFLKMITSKGIVSQRIIIN